MTEQEQQETRIINKIEMLINNVATGTIRNRLTELNIEFQHYVAKRKKSDEKKK